MLLLKTGRDTRKVQKGGKKKIINSRWVGDGMVFSQRGGGVGCQLREKADCMVVDCSQN